MIFDTIIYCDVTNFDPLESWTDCQAIIINQIYDTLFEIDPLTLQIEPSLVERYTFDIKSTTYTFHLNQNIKFHDGSPLQVDDVIFTLERKLLNLGDRYHDFFNIQGAKDFHQQKTKNLSGLKKVSDQTFKISLNAPNSLFLFSLTSITSSIIPKRYKEELDNGQFSINPIGSGSFSLLSYRSAMIAASIMEYCKKKPDVKMIAASVKKYDEEKSDAKLC